MYSYLYDSMKSKNSITQFNGFSDEQEEMFDNNGLNFKVT